MTATSTRTRALWKLIEEPVPSDRPVREHTWAVSDEAFTFVETVRNTLPDSDALPEGINKFDVAHAWATQLEGVRGGGFEYRWAGESDRRLDPSWVTLRSVAHDPATGRIVAAGSPTHRTWDLSSAYDLGALTGSNGGSWRALGHGDGLFYPTNALYIGSERTGQLAPVTSSTNIISVDLSPAGDIAVLESYGSVGAVSIVTGIGELTRLTLLEDHSGNEVVRFSPDANWLLVARYDGSYLIEVATGRFLRLALRNCDWWPAEDSMLIELVVDDGRCAPRLFSLASGEYVEDLPTLAFDVPLVKGLEHMFHPRCSPDGKQMLVTTFAGVSAEYRERFGVGGHLGLVDLPTGQASLVFPALLNTSAPWERDVADARWTQPPPLRETSLHSSFGTALQEPARVPDELINGRYAEEAEQLLVTSLNHVISRTQAGLDVAPFMPDVVVSVATLSEDPARFAGQAEWLTGLARATSDLAANGQFDSRTEAAWSHFWNALEAAVDGNPNRVLGITSSWA